MVFPLFSDLVNYSFFCVVLFEAESNCMHNSCCVWLIFTKNKLTNAINYHFGHNKRKIENEFAYRCISDIWYMVYVKLYNLCVIGVHYTQFFTQRSKFNKLLNRIDEIVS